MTLGQIYWDNMPIWMRIEKFKLKIVDPIQYTFSYKDLSIESKSEVDNV